MHTVDEEQAKQLTGHVPEQTPLFKESPLGQLVHWVTLVEEHVKQFEDEVQVVHVFPLRTKLP